MIMSIFSKNSNNCRSSIRIKDLFI